MRLLLEVFFSCNSTDGGIVVKKLISLALMIVFVLASPLVMNAQAANRYAVHGVGYPLEFYFDSQPISITVVPHLVLDAIDVHTVSVGTTIFGEIVAQNLRDDEWIWNEWIFLSDMGAGWDATAPQWNVADRQNASFTFDAVGRFMVIAEAQTAVFEVVVVPGEAPAQPTTPTPPAEMQSISVYIDGIPLIMDVEPKLVNDRALVPLRAIFEALGAEVDWNPQTRTVTGTNADTVVVLAVGSMTPTVNGQVVPIDVPAQIVNDRTLVPLRFVAESFGVEVYWNGSTRTITITT